MAHLLNKQVKQTITFKYMKRKHQQSQKARNEEMVKTNEKPITFITKMTVGYSLFEMNQASTQRRIKELD